MIFENVGDRIPLIKREGDAVEKMDEMAGGKGGRWPVRTGTLPPYTYRKEWVLFWECSNIGKGTGGMTE